MTEQPIAIVVNPYAGRWKVQQRIGEIEATLNRRHLTYNLLHTEAPGHGIELARRAVAAGASTVVAVGGDSTVNEVVNGIRQATEASETIRLGIIPLGTANDLAEMLGIPLEVEAACARLSSGHTRLIDLCRVNNRYFANNSGVGLEPMVTVRAEKIKHMQGPLRYLAAALQTVWSGDSWHGVITWDGGHYEGPILLVSVGNGPRTGGIFWMTPDARFDDGQMDFVFAAGMSRLKVLSIFPKLFTKRLPQDRSVTNGRTTALTIVINRSPLHADGEVITLDATEIRYQILPEKLKIIV